MRRTSSEFKRLAKGALMGHYGIAIGVNLVANLLISSISLLLTYVFTGNDTLSLLLFYVTSVIVSLLGTVLQVGPLYLLLNISRNREAKFGNLFFGFTHQPDRVILITLLLLLIAFGCMVPGIGVTIAAKLLNQDMLLVLGILLLIAGFIVAFILELNYELALILYLDNPEIGVLDLMRESRRLMKGNKGRFFYILLSFIGLGILSIFTCYIGLLWIVPYQQMTTLQFYREVIGEI